MKRNLFVLAAATALFLCAAFVVPAPKASAAAVSRAECVLEASSRRILHEKDAETTLPMASTTKLLTALLVIEDCDLDEEFPIPAEAEGVEGSSVYLKAGDVYSVRDLLYGLMLRSGNDCAVALAICHSGSVQAFVRTMNARAARMGAEHSRFANPHGLPDAGHYTTARDLAVLAARAIENPVFREIVSCKYYAPRGYANKNKMLTGYEGAIGVKTGFTAAAGRCLVTAAERDGMRLVSVVLNSPEMYERSAELLDAAFSRYKMRTLCKGDGQIGDYNFRRGFCYPMTDAEFARTNIEIEPYPEKEAGEIAGIMRIRLENSLLFSQNLYMI